MNAAAIAVIRMMMVTHTVTAMCIPNPAAAIVIIMRIRGMEATIVTIVAPDTNNR